MGSHPLRNVYSTLEQKPPRKQKNKMSKAIFIFSLFCVAALFSSAFGYPAPVNGYPAPANGYPAPVNGYPAPVNGYPAPVNGYPAPVNGYPAPVNRYPAPAN